MPLLEGKLLPALTSFCCQLLLKGRSMESAGGHMNHETLQPSLHCLLHTEESRCACPRQIPSKSTNPARSMPSVISAAKV